MFCLTRRTDPPRKGCFAAMNGLSTARLRSSMHAPGEGPRPTAMEIEGREVLPGWGLHPPQLRVLPQPCVVFAQKRRSAEKAFVGLGVKRSGSLRFCAVGTIRSDYAGGAAGICRPAGARAAGGSVNPGSRPGLPSVAPPALGRGDSTTKRRRSVTVSGVSTENVTPPRSCLVLRGFAASREISSSHDSIGQRREDRRQTCRPRTPVRAQVWLSHGIRRTLPTEGDVSRSRFVQELGKTEKRSSTSSYNFCGRV
jgi:hypothetical protein